MPKIDEGRQRKKLKRYTNTTSPVMGLFQKLPHENLTPLAYFLNPNADIAFAIEYAHRKGLISYPFANVNPLLAAAMTAIPSPEPKSTKVFPVKEVWVCRVSKADSKLLAFVLTKGAPRLSRTDGSDGTNIKWGISIATPPKIHIHLVFFTAVVIQ